MDTDIFRPYKSHISRLGTASQLFPSFSSLLVFCLMFCLINSVCPSYIIQGHTNTGNHLAPRMVLRRRSRFQQVLGIGRCTTARTCLMPVGVAAATMATIKARGYTRTLHGLLISCLGTLATALTFPPYRITRLPPTSRSTIVKKIQVYSSFPFPFSSFSKQVPCPVTHPI
jgi:hypothetical protein